MTVGFMPGYRISIVSYLNAQPFVYGLRHAGLTNNYEVGLDMPSSCAQKLMTGGADIGLVPVAILPLLPRYEIISDYCIGAIGKVNSVMLYSQVPLDEIKSVLLDYQSRTSVKLVKVLSKELWKKGFEWLPAKEGYESQIKGNVAGVIIGDRTFALGKQFKHAYDLSESWHQLTGLPFVFACWVANKPIEPGFLELFNSSLAFGLEHRETLIRELLNIKNYPIDIKDYLMHKINYDLDGQKKIALELFLHYLKNVE